MPLHGIWSKFSNYDLFEHNKAIEDHINSDNFNEDEYIKLLTGQYLSEEQRKDTDNIENHIAHLFGDKNKWQQDLNILDDEESKKLLEQDSSAVGILKNHPFNNSKNNSKILRYLEDRAKGTDDWNEIRLLRSFLRSAKLDKKDLAKHFKENYGEISENDHFTKEDFDYAIKQLSPSEISSKHIKSPFFDESHARRLLNSKEKKQNEIWESLADKGFLQPKHVEKIIDEDNLREDYDKIIDYTNYDKFLSILPENRRKEILDEKLGITGGSYIKERPSDPEEHADWEENENWQNWTHGKGLDRGKSTYWARSKYLTDDQIEHIKRHGNLSQKYDLFRNENIDTKHAAEMWQKWDDNDVDHGYDFDKWKKHFFGKQDYSDIYDEYVDEATHIAEDNYPIEEYLDDHHGGRAYSPEDIISHIRGNPGLHNTMGENPDFDPKQPEHPELNPKQIDFADKDSGGGHSYSLTDHPEYHELLDRADSYLRNKYGLPDDVYDGYRDAIQDDIDTNVNELNEQNADNFHKKWENLPTHLEGKIPGVQKAIMEDRLDETKSALNGLDLEGPYSDISPHGYSRINKDLLPVTHEYGDGLHYLQMIKDHADANNGKTDLGSMIKRYPGARDKLKEIFGDKQSVTSDEMQERIDNLPKTKYNVSMRNWDKNASQNINGQHQLVIRLDHSPESHEEMKKDPELFDTFKEIQKSSRSSGHPVNTDTIGWCRVDTSDPKHWIIDETQSDFGSSLRKMIERSKTDPERKQKALDHLTKIEDIHKNWRENILNYVINLAKKHGVEKISTHSPESKAGHTGSDKIHTVYKDSYQRIPRQMGFSPVKGSSLPLTEKGRNAFTKKTIKRDENSEKMQFEAMNHHLRQAKIHYELAGLSNDEKIDIPDNIKPESSSWHMNMFEEHKKKFYDHKNQAMKNNPQDPYAKNINFNEFRTKDIGQKDFDATAEAIKSNTAAPHLADELLNSTKSDELHPAHTLDLTLSSLKKSEEDFDMIGEIFAIKLMEIL